MLVRIGRHNGLLLDLPATVTWEATAGQSLGSATISVPRDSAAWSDEVISEYGAFLVQALSPAGIWSGIADSPTWTPAGMSFRAQHLMSWARVRHVSTSRRFAGVVAGVIVQRAIQDALIGLGSAPVTIGPVVMAPPVIANYEFRGQSLLSVLADMQNQTGQSWQIDDVLRFSWVQRVGRYRELTLVDDGRYVSSMARTPLADQHRETIEIEQSGRQFGVTDTGVPGLWPSQQIERIR